MFDQRTQELVGYYVYALFDPKTPLIPFYVGKGRGNRVFAHAAGEADLDTADDLLGAKLSLIREIRNRGDRVDHKIVRWSLLEEEAFKLEAALIDMVNHMLPETLKNEVSGHGVAEGFRDAMDLAIELGATQLKTNLPIMIIKIDRRWDELVNEFSSASGVPTDRIWAATQGEWKVNPDRASRAVCVLSVARGLVRAVFVPSGWEASTSMEGRKRMSGMADSTRFKEFIGQSVSGCFQKGSQNPIKYLGC
jgi:hypothetical protein